MVKSLESIVIDNVVFKVGESYSEKVNSIVHSICNVNGHVMIELSYPYVMGMDKEIEFENVISLINGEISLHDSYGWCMSEIYTNMQEFIDGNIDKLSYYCNVGETCETWWLGTDEIVEEIDFDDLDESIDYGLHSTSYGYDDLF